MEEKYGEPAQQKERNIYFLVNLLKYAFALLIAYGISLMYTFDAYATAANLLIAIGLVIFAQNFICIHLYRRQRNFENEIILIACCVTGYGLILLMQNLNTGTTPSQYYLFLLQLQNLEIISSKYYFLYSVFLSSMAIGYSKFTDL